MTSRFLALSSVLAVLAAGCASASDSETPNDSTEQDVSSKLNAKVAETDLVSDRPGAVTLDPNLSNAWGMAFNAQGGVWVSNNHSATSTVYDVTGKLLLTVSVPTSPTATDPGAPTGQVFNTGTGFKGDKFIFADEGGTISGWQPGPAGTVLRSDQTPAHAGYKGIAIAGDKIFVTDFHNNKIDTFDSTYTKVATVGLTDATIPAGYAAFNIQNLDGKLYVTYAQQDAEAGDDVHGPGKGFVNVFEIDGTLIGRVASRGALNGPWGLAIAPATYGKLAGKLLVGNFGGSTIEAFDVSFTTTTSGGGGGGYGYGYGYGAAPAAPVTVTKVHASHAGSLLAADGKKLSIPGLWGLAFSPVTGDLFFTAGPDDESHGLFGKLTIAP